MFFSTFKVFSPKLHINMNIILYYKKYNILYSIELYLMFELNVRKGRLKVELKQRV